MFGVDVGCGGRVDVIGPVCFCWMRCCLCSLLLLLVFDAHVLGGGGVFMLLLVFVGVGFVACVRCRC